MAKKLKLTAISKSLVLTFLIMVCSSVLVLAQNSFTVTPKIEGGNISIIITETTNLNDEVSILILDKTTNDIKYINQEKLEDGKVEFKTMLSNGDYLIKVNTTTNTLSEISTEIKVTDSSKVDTDNISGADTNNGSDNNNNNSGNSDNGNGTGGSSNGNGLVNTGSQFDTEVLVGIGAVMLLIGLTSMIYFKKKATK